MGIWRTITITLAVVCNGYFWSDEPIYLFSQEYWMLFGTGVLTAWAIDAILREMDRSRRVARSQVVIQEAAKDEE